MYQIHGIAPLTSTQRRMLRDVLDAEWRETVRCLTSLATEFHGAEGIGDDELVDTLSQQLAGVRRRLVDVEAAMTRLDSGTYGRCDGCDRQLPFEQLEHSPAARYCGACRAA